MTLEEIDIKLDTIRSILAQIRDDIDDDTKGDIVLALSQLHVSVDRIRGFIVRDLAEKLRGDA